MSTSSIRAAFAGGVGAAIVMTAGAALAGSGVGGVFNLGRSNSVDATTSLHGQVNGAQLAVRNDSTGQSATGVHITTKPGRPPLTVTGSAAMVHNLNADLLDGREASGFARVSSTQTSTLFPFQDSASTIATVSLTVPRAGFVVLQANAIALSSASCDCNAILRFHDVAANSDTPPQVSSVRPDRMASVSIIAVVHATGGPHTYTLNGGTYAISGGGSVGFYNVAATAFFVPFNGQGTTTATAHVHVRSVGGKRTTSGIVRPR